MNHDEIIEMAKEADIIDFRDELDDPHVAQMVEFLHRFAALVAEKAAAKEREACAQIAQVTVCDTDIPTGIKIYGTKVAQAIRARTTNHFC